MMYGYAMRCGASGHTKIGIAEDVPRRKKQHERGSAQDMRLLLTFSFACKPDAKEWEKRVLLEFCHERVGSTEWLLASDALESAIDSGILGGVASIDLIQFSRRLYRAIYPKTFGKPFIYRHEDPERGWCCIITHPKLQLSWQYWDFESPQEAVSWVPDLKYEVRSTDWGPIEDYDYALA